MTRMKSLCISVGSMSMLAVDVIITTVYDQNKASFKILSCELRLMELNQQVFSSKSPKVTQLHLSLLYSSTNLNCANLVFDMSDMSV